MLTWADPEALTSPGIVQIQLSTYGDSLGGDLKALKGFIDRNLQGAAPSAALCSCQCMGCTLQVIAPHHLECHPLWAAGT